MTLPDSASLLVVDDETTLLHILSTLLSDHGYDVHTAASAEEALAKLETFLPAVALFDIVLPKMTGLDLLAEFKRRAPETEVVIMTSQASLDTALEAIRRGAYDYLQKPFDELDDVVRTLDRALEKQNLAADNRRLLLDQRRRNAELTAAVARLSALVEAGQALGDLRPLPDLLELFVDLVTRQLGVGRSSLMLLDPLTGELRIAASRGVGGFDIDEVRVRLGDSISGSVAQSKLPVLVRDLLRNPAAGLRSSSDMANSFLCVPIVLGSAAEGRQDVLGVINVTNRDSGVPFDEADLAFLSSLAGQLAVAIEGARRFDELRVAYDALKIAQEQLLLSERKKAVAAMAAGVAHDFNNALAVMLGRVELMLGQLDGGKQLAPARFIADLELTRKTALQAAERVQRLQHLNRPAADRTFGPVALDAVVRDAVDMTRPKWKVGGEATGRPIELQLELAPTPSITGNPHELGQLVSNLVFNAVEAMPRGGRVVLRTRHEKGRVWLDVEDTGVGMSEATRRRLFEAFFTTKSYGQGLGTSIVRAIATRHDATIEVDSTEGRGSRFVVGFPARPDEGGGSDAAGPPSDGPRRTAHVLLVDDDPMVLDTHDEILRAAGHSVTAVASGAEALAHLARKHFDLVVTDLSMPGMSGLELARAIKRDVPGLPVVMLTGWSVGEQESEIVATVDQVVTKPCALARLLEMVDRAVQGRLEA